MDLTLSDDEEIHEVSSSTSISQPLHASTAYPSVRPFYRPPGTIFPSHNLEPRSSWGDSWGRSSLNQQRSSTSWGNPSDSPAALLNQRLSTERQLQVMEDQVRQLAERDRVNNKFAQTLRLLE